MKWDEAEEANGAAPCSERRPFISYTNETTSIPPPEDLDAVTFDVGDDAYALLSFPLPDIELPQGLTAAERAVTEALLDGRSVCDIAQERGTSPRTVNNQIAAVYLKLGVRSRAELVELCMRSGSGDRQSAITLCVDGVAPRATLSS